MKASHYFYEFSLWVRRKYLDCEIKDFDGSISLEYLEFGNPNGEKIIFLHGFADEKHNFYLAGKKLAKKYRVIVPDIPGFGKSTQHESHAYTMDNYVIWFNEFIKFLGYGKLHVMGNSLGGAIAIHLALNVPEHIKSLVLIDCGAVIPEKNASIYDDFLLGKNIFVFDSPDDIDSFLGRVFHVKPFIPWPMKIFIAHQMYQLRNWHEKLTKDFLHGGHLQMTLEEKIRMASNLKLKSINLPTLIIWGEYDSLFPVEIGEIIHREIKKSKLIVLKNTGHCPQVERPGVFCRHVENFISSIAK
jgi:abhydrolase domain-containing protein 6